MQPVAQRHSRLPAKPGPRQRNIGLPLRGVVGRQRAADKLADTAADTRAAMVGLAVLGVTALLVALVALAIAVKKD